MQIKLEVRNIQHASKMVKRLRDCGLSVRQDGRHIIYLATNGLQALMFGHYAELALCESVIVTEGALAFERANPAVAVDVRWQ
jgi:hypothetical protein